MKPHPTVLARSDVARRTGVSPKTVDFWRTLPEFPEPRWSVGGRPAWDWDEVNAWRIDRAAGILPGGPVGADPAPAAQDVRSERPCSHPREKLRSLGYATVCDECGAKVR